ncbi:hypothetical protein LSAT2_021052 [Lamellibrachia satsuma]|nr:hypothetical protein LSAT2_021052 [Lamellibrachia satsuma]
MAPVARKGHRGVSDVRPCVTAPRAMPPLRLSPASSTPPSTASRHGRLADTTAVVVSRYQPPSQLSKYRRVRELRLPPGSTPGHSPKADVTTDSPARPRAGRGAFPSATRPCPWSAA